MVVCSGTQNKHQPHLLNHTYDSSEDEKMFTVARSSRTVSLHISELIPLLRSQLLMLLQSLRVNAFRALTRGVSTYDTIVIGGGWYEWNSGYKGANAHSASSRHAGPGGYVAAIKAAQLGQKVV